MIKYLNLLLFGGMIVMNYLANALPLNNHTTGELSDAYSNLFVPAGITFSIWGLIYALLAVYCVIQFLTSYQSVIRRINWLFAITCVFNAAWIVCWHYEKLFLSLIVMAVLLISLIAINMKLLKLPLGIIKASFGIYLGWICIATIANVTALLVHYKWNGFGITDELWAITMIFIGALIASLTIRKLYNPFVGVAVIWAFAGIVIKRQDDYFYIVVAALVATGIVATITILSFFRKKLA
jgi:hypothetical protein